MAHDEWRQGLRVVVAQHDAEAIARLLDEQLPDEGLQHAGDAVLCALAADPHAAQRVATRIADGLRERFWDGDEDARPTISGSKYHARVGIMCGFRDGRNVSVRDAA